MAGDPSWNGVGLLLHGDGANGGSVITDNGPSKRTITANSVRTSTVVAAKVGSASLSFDGSSTGYLSMALDAALQPGAGDFTFEAWVYLTATPAANATVGSCFAADNSGFRFLISSGRVFTGLSVAWPGGQGAASTQQNPSAAIPLNTWTHIAQSRTGTKLYSFVNGVKDSEYTLAAGSTIPASSYGAYEIGRNIGNTWLLAGFLDEYRLTIGTGRYSANFTPSTTPLPDGLGQVQGAVTNSAGAPVSRIVRAYRRDTGALVANITSDASTGAYSFYTPTLDELTVVALDSATSGTIYDDICERVIPG